jgi:hypothetical protein
MNHLIAKVKLGLSSLQDGDGLSKWESFSSVACLDVLTLWIRIPIHRNTGRGFFNKYPFNQGLASLTPSVGLPFSVLQPYWPFSSSRLATTSGSLHMLFPLPGIFSPRHSHGLLPLLSHASS